MKPACFGTASTNCLADMSKGYPCWQKEGCAKETRRRWIWKLYKEEHLDVGEITKKVLGKQFVRGRGLSIKKLKAKTHHIQAYELQRLPQGCKGKS